MPGDDEQLHLQGVYHTLYNAITRPDFKFAVTRYFIDEWVPLLGPSLAWLIVGLRQQCFWNRRRDWCIVDKATLSQETDLDERTIERCLKKPFSRWFVIEVTHRYRYRNQLGKKVRDKNRYQLLLDEPLSPRHQLGLAVLLRQLMPEQAADPLEAALAALQAALELPHLADKIAYTGKIPKTIQRRTVSEMVADTAAINLADYAGDERVILLDQRCSQLYNLIVQPNKIYVGWQYFRLEWVRLLGHSLAWLVIYLRRHCFWDEARNELRDNFTTYKKDLAAAIGQTSRNLANLMNNPYAPLFFTIVDTVDPTAEDYPKPGNQPTRYQVRMIDEPLTPVDQQRVAAELRQRLQGDFYGQDPENGQLNLFPILNGLSNRQNFAYGQLSEKMPLREQKECRLENDVTEKMPQHDKPTSGKNAATLKDSIILSESEKIQQQIESAAVTSKGLQVMLEDLSVQEPARSKLLANPDLTIAKVGAWVLYAETQPNLRNPQSYIIKRLLADDPPPAEFLAFAQLSDATWSLFEETAYLLRTGQPFGTEIEPELLETFIPWADVYGGLDPEETRRLLLPQQKRAWVSQGSPTWLSNHPEPADPPHELARHLWQTTLEQLQFQMTKQTFDTWLKQTEVLDYQAGVFTIDAKNAYAKDWLENRLAKVIEQTLTLVAGEPIHVRFALREQVSS